VFIALAGTLVVLASDRGDVRPWARILKVAALPAVWLTIFGVIFYGAYRSRHLTGRDLLKREPDLRDPVSVTFDDAGVELTQGARSTRWTWAAFTGWTETDALFVLIPSAADRLLIPKRAMPAGQQVELRALFQSQVSRVTPGFPVGPAGGK